MKPISKIVLLLLCHISIVAQEIIVQNETKNGFIFNFKEKKAIFIEIGNVKDNYDNTSLEVNLPPNFKLLTKAYISSLEAGKKANTFFALQTLPQTAAGNYSIELKLLSNSQVLDIVSLDLAVKKHSNIAINPINRPSFYQASENSTVSYLIRNNGNVKEEIRLESSTGEVLGDNIITLDIGESKTVETKNIFPKNNPGLTMISFNLEAYVEGRKEPFSSAFSSSYLSNTTVKSDKFHRFPVSASVSYNVYNTSFGDFESVQYDINGSGFLDKDSKRELSFIARGPNRFEIPGFGMTDQYYVGYKEKKLNLEVGDIPFRISELIEGSRYARGLNLSFTPYINGFNIFYFKPRFFNDISTEYGISYQRRPNYQFNWKLIYLHKDHVVQNEQKATDFVSLTSAIKKDNFSLDSEIGASRTNGEISAAFSNSGFWKFSKFRLSSNTIITGKNYYGYYTNSTLYSNAINYYINKKLRITLNSNISQLNPSFDEFYYTTSPFYAFQSANLSYYPNKKNRFYISAITGKREDRQTLKTYDFNEKIGRFSYKLDIGSWNFMNDTDYGITENLLLEDSFSKEDEIFRNRFTIQYGNNRKVNLGGFAEYLKTTKYITALERTEFLFYGLNAGVRIKNGVYLNVNYRNNFTPEELYRQQNYLDAIATFNFKNHQVSLTASIGKNPIIESDRMFLGSVKYTANLNVPLSKKKNLGHLIGHLEGEKTDGVIFNFNDHKIISDENGQFKLRDIESGRYNLGIDRGSLGYGNILDTDGPLVFDIKEDSTNHITFKVIKTGKVNGKVEILGSEKKNESLKNILIEISQKDFSKLTTTDSYGTFNFSELKPGDYAVKVVSENVLNKYTLLSSHWNITVEKGANTPLIIEMEEKKKKIRFQSDTILLSGS